MDSSKVVSRFMISIILIILSVVLLNGTFRIELKNNIKSEDYLPSTESQGRYEKIEIGNKSNEIKAIYKVISDDIREWPVILTVRAKGNYGISKKADYYEIWVDNKDNIQFKTNWTIIKLK